MDYLQKSNFHSKYIKTIRTEISMRIVFIYYIIFLYTTLNKNNVESYKNNVEKKVFIHNMTGELL